MVILQQHDTISACRRDALAWVARAKSALDNLPVHPLREILSELADFVVSRVS
jgi:octaprenyl-diphosphate synthase